MERLARFVTKARPQLGAICLTKTPKLVDDTVAALMTVLSEASSGKAILFSKVPTSANAAAVTAA